MKVDKGLLLIAGQPIKDVVLWAETAPPLVEVESILKSEVGRLKIWNTWRDDRGTMDAWIGNAGLIVVEDAEHVRLHCSDGNGEPNFDDLVVELNFGSSLKR